MLAEVPGDKPAVATAPRLLGAILAVDGVAVRLTEVEAYEGALDPGSHAYRGQTPRNATMFGPAGRLYCYRSYGIHACANFVCGPEGQGTGVLIRSGEVVRGHERARLRRQQTSPQVQDRDLARGPGRLTQALGIDLAFDGAEVEQSSGVDLDEFVAASNVVGPSRVNLLWGPALPTHQVGNGPRVGVSGPGGAAPYLWRWWVREDWFVSAYREAQPRRRAARA